MLSTRIEPGVANVQRGSDSKQLLLEVAPIELLIMLLAAGLMGALLVILYQLLSHRRKAEFHRIQAEAAELAERAGSRSELIPRPIRKPPTFISSSSFSLDFHR